MISALLTVLPVSLSPTPFWAQASAHLAPDPKAAAPTTSLTSPARPPEIAPATTDLASASRPSDIGYFTATQLSTRCSQTDPASSSYCFAYIAAVTDTARAYEIWLNAREFCLPTNISQSETRRAFLTYIGAYPSDSSGQAASVIVNALKKTYPCD